MNNTCDVCSKNTKGWVTTSYKASTFCYCSYECYKKMPTIIPTQHIYKCLEVDNPGPIIVPLTRKDINSFKQIIDYNFLGLSHTAINLKLLENFYVPEGIIAVDWWIFTILILNGATGKYIDRAITYYRQYNDNFVGIKKTLNEDRLKTGIKVKKAHYTHVVEYCKNNHLQLALTEYTKKNEEIFELEIALRDKVFRKIYIEIINQLMGKIYQGWWSEIVDLTTWRKYAD